MLAAVLIVGFALWRLRDWDDLWRDLMEPSEGTPYSRAVIGAGHALVGAAIVSLLPDWALVAASVRVLVAVLYWTLKEAGDLRRGGDLRDGLEDAAFVWLGAYYGPWWWPILILGAMGCVGLTGRR